MVERVHESDDEFFLFMHKHHMIQYFFSHTTKVVVKGNFKILTP